MGEGRKELCVLRELEDKFVISIEEEITYLKFVAKIEQCKWDEMLKA